jgi:hypothetical protein
VTEYIIQTGTRAQMRLFFTGARLLKLMMMIIIIIKGGGGIIQWNLDLSFPQQSFSRMYRSPFSVPNEVPYT